MFDSIRIYSVLSIIWLYVQLYFIVNYYLNTIPSLGHTVLLIITYVYELIFCSASRCTVQFEQLSLISILEGFINESWNRNLVRFQNGSFIFGSGIGRK